MLFDVVPKLHSPRPAPRWVLNGYRKWLPQRIFRSRTCQRNIFISHKLTKVERSMCFMRIGFLLLAVELAKFSDILFDVRFSCTWIIYTTCKFWKVQVFSKCRTFQRISEKLAERTKKGHPVCFNVFEKNFRLGILLR